MMEEAKIMSKVEHPNVLPLYGICIADQTVKIITPYRRLGSLYNFLKTNYEKISGKLQLQLCQQISSVSDKNYVIVLTLPYPNIFQRIGVKWSNSGGVEVCLKYHFLNLSLRRDRN
jgi:serine/threonine protein kinase